MSIELDCSEPEKELNKALPELIAATARIIAGDVLLAPRHIGKAYNLYKPKQNKPGQIACAFWNGVLWTAVTDAITRHRYARCADEKILKDALTELFLSVFDRTQPGSCDVTDFIEPTNFSLYKDSLRNIYPSLVKKIEPGALKSETQLQHELDASLRAALWSVWATEKNNEFQDLLARFSSPVAEGHKRRQAWARHYQWIEAPLSERPLYLQEEDSSITLRSVYTPLRCTYHSNLENDEEEEESGAAYDQSGSDHEKPRKVHLGWLNDTLHRWLEQGDKKDAIRVIDGGPGSGKSTSARIFASDVARDDKWRVCFVELQHFSFAGDLEAKIKKHFASGRDGAGLRGDPLTWRDDEQRPLLFVFDGLDELVRTDESAEDITKKFVQKVRFFVNAQNGTELAVKAIILGRPAATAPACREADIDLENLLHVMPLCALNDELLQLSEKLGQQDEKRPLDDPEKLASKDHRKVFWENWCIANGEPGDAPAPVLENSNFAELTAEPLLFYLLLFAGLDEEGATAEHSQSAKALENRNRVYQKIFTKVYKRDDEKRKDRAEKRFSKDEFFALMECLGLAVWHGGGKTGTDKYFVPIRNLYCPDDMGTNFSQIADAADVENAAMQFYVWSDYADDRGFEFIHKSFGEYLTARALLQKAHRLSACRGISESDFAVRWLELTGRGILSSNIIRFLQDEARLRAQGWCDDLKNNLSKKMNHVIEFGMPAHIIKFGMPAHDAGHDSWRAVETHGRNATAALLGLLNASARALKDGADGSPENKENPKHIITLTWPDAPAPRRFIDGLHISSDDDTPAKQLLQVMDFSSADLSFLKLYEADLRGAKLDGAYLNRANLSGANLRGADLNRADLRGATLHGADLNRANLSGAKLHGADLHGAYLNRANLSGADLNRANLSGANLSGANLSGANLRGADLSEADLSEADLSWADLSGAKLNRANLSEADLNRADLSWAKLNRADLSWANLSGANLNRADLHGAYLSEANLSGANLNRADLSGANLSGANLSEAETRSANFSRSLLVSVNLNGARDLTQSQINSAFGDATTQLPPPLKRPDHWPDEELPVDVVITQWRAWIARQP